MSAELSWVMALAALFAVVAIKIVAEHERLVILQNGKPVRVAGPGLVLVCPVLQSMKRVDIRPQSMPLPDAKVDGFGPSSIASGRFKYHILDPIKTQATADVRSATDQTMRTTLISVLSNATISQCLFDTPTLEKEILELANRQTKSWGVIVSDLTLSDLRLHRQLLRQLEALMGALAADMALTLGAMVAAAPLMIEEVGEGEQEGQGDVIYHAPDSQNDDAIIEDDLKYKFGINA